MQHLEKHIRNLVELNRKVIAMQNFDKFSINESKLSYLVEAVDEGDMAKLADTVAAFKKTLDSVAKQIEVLTTQIVSNNDEAAQASETLTKYIDKYREALTELENVSREVDFTSGTISSFKANQMTIPGLVAASTDAIATLEAFLKGFENFKSKVVRSLVPLSKDDNKSLSQQAGGGEAPAEGEGEEGGEGAAPAAAGAKGKLPSIEKMINLSIEMYNTATGGDSIFDKIGKFIDKILNPIDTLKKAFQQSSDDVKKVMDKFPNFDANILGKVTAQLMINVKVSALKGIKPTAVPDTAGVKAAATEANKEVSKGGEADAGAAQQGQAQSATDQAQPSTEEEVSTELNPTDLANKGKEYIQKVDVSPQGTKVTIGGKTYIKGVTTASGQRPRKRKAAGANVEAGQEEQAPTLPTKTVGKVKSENINQFSLRTIYESLFLNEAIRWYDASAAGPDEKASSADEIENNSTLYSKIVAAAAKELGGKAKEALVGVLKGEKGQKKPAETPAQAAPKADDKAKAQKDASAKSTTSQPAVSKPTGTQQTSKKVATPTLPQAQEKKPASQKQTAPSASPKKASPTLPKPSRRVKKEGMREKSISKLFEAKLIGGLGFGPISQPVEQEKEENQLDRWLQLAGLK